VYLQTNHPAVLFFQIQALLIWELSIQRFLDASIIDSHLFKRFHWISYCKTDLILLCLSYLFLVIFASQVFQACCMFSLAVHHSKFSTELFNLFPSIWLIWYLLSLFWMNAIATSLCALYDFTIQLLESLICKYQQAFTGFNIFSNHFLL